MEIIAEIGQNHNGDINLALELIRQAKLNGADVAKFQLYDARALFPKENNEWYEYNCKTELSRQQLKIIVEACKDVGIEFMASVFDIERIQWLEEVGAKRYKIASRSIFDQKLISAVAATGKKMIVSLGHWNRPEFPEISASGGVDYLYCISKYPTDLAEVNLNKIDFTKYAGFSDHTIGITACLAALSRGAKIIEKHFTLDKNFFGPDHLCSIEPQDLKIMSKFRNELKACLGI